MGQDKAGMDRDRAGGYEPIERERRERERNNL